MMSQGLRSTIYRLLVILCFGCSAAGLYGQKVAIDVVMYGFKPSDTIRIGQASIEEAVIVPLHERGCIKQVKLDASVRPEIYWLFCRSRSVAHSLYIHDHNFTVHVFASDRDSIAFRSSPINEMAARLNRRETRLEAIRDSLRGDIPPHIAHHSDTIIPSFFLKYLMDNPASPLNPNIVDFLLMSGQADSSDLEFVVMPAY